MNVWNPSVEHGTNEFSLSQIWLVAGHYNDSDLNTVEAGWQVILLLLFFSLFFFSLYYDHNCSFTAKMDK